MDSTVAYLSNHNEYTLFKVGNETIRFATSPYLEYYTKVKEYDNGYIVVDAKYSTSSDIEEEYIDMEYIFKELGLSLKKLSAVREVNIV